MAIKQHIVVRSECKKRLNKQGMLASALPVHDSARRQITCGGALLVARDCHQKGLQEGAGVGVEGEGGRQLCCMLPRSEGMGQILQLPGIPHLQHSARVCLSAQSGCQAVLLVR